MILLKDIEVKRGKKQLLSIPELKLRAGRVTVILGPNGAGKSTFLKVLSGSLKPDKGEILLFGQELGEWKPKALARSRAMLSQHYAMPFPMNVRELVAMGRLPHKPSSDDDRMIDEVMKEMDVFTFANRNVMTLSGGEQQRAHMARVLLQLKTADKDEAKLLLLDEPISSLDIVHQRTLLDKARETARHGYTVVMVLHDINIATHYADTFLLFKKGKIVSETSNLCPDELGRIFEIPMRRIEDKLLEKHYYVAAAGQI